MRDHTICHKKICRLELILPADTEVTMKRSKESPAANTVKKRWNVKRNHVVTCHLLINVMENNLKWIIPMEREMAAISLRLITLTANQSGKRRRIKDVKNLTPIQALTPALTPA